jgi:hypothetical protein
MMATRIESGQMQLARPGNVPMVQAQMPTVQPIGFQVAAQEQGRMAQLIQRMSESLFREAGQMAEQEGFRYAAENPLTDEEIALARDGAITKPTGRIFDDAFRKARSLQLASHFEAEGINTMSRLLPDIEAGRITSEQVILKLREMNSGLTASLAKLDPQAAMKFNASMAASGNTIVRKALDTEIKNDRERNRIKFDVYFNDVARVLQDTIEQNPEQSTQLIAMHEQNINRAAIALGDATMQREYAAKIRKEAVDAQVGVLSRKLMTSDFAAANSLAVINGIRNGQFLPDERFNEVLRSMVAQDPKAGEEVIKNFRAEISARITKLDQDDALDKRNRELQASDLIAQYHRPNTPPSVKSAIADQLVNLRVMSTEQIERLLNPTQPPGDMLTFTTIQYQIDNGFVRGWNELLPQATRAGMNGDQINRLYQRMREVENPDAAAAQRLINATAGVPDVRSVFATKENEAQIAKAEALTARYQQLVTDFRRTNEGQAVPFRDLAQQAIDAYNTTERADLQKTQALTRLNAIVADLVKENKLAETVKIDATTNLDDLLLRYPRLRQDDITALRQQQRILQGASR